MSDVSANLSMPYIQPSQAQKHVTHNEALRQLDALVQLSVQSATQTAPPPAPNDGNRFLLPAGGTGAWAGQDGKIAVFQDVVWAFYTPNAGWQIWIEDEGESRFFDGTAWVVPPLQNLEHVGIQTSADDTNRLAVAAPATLLTHAGGSHQLKINKADATDTASLLFQTGWAGRAEMGTAGSDDFEIKVSSDGTTWRDALTINSDTGLLGLGTSDPQAHVHCVSDTTGKMFQMSGVAADGSSDPVHGAVLVLTHNSPGNRQFTLMDSENGRGVRFLSNSLDGVKNHGANRDRLTLGTSTHGVIVLNELDARGPVSSTGYVRPASYTVTTLPNAATSGAGAMIYVSDEVGGAVMAFSDESNWRRMTDRAVVS